MQQIPQLKLLLTNPLLNSYSYTPVTSAAVTQALGLRLTIPLKTTFPFLFSCFALSIDGKLCYPDALSGFNIALANKHASLAEKTADLFYLMLGRSICDAVIVGSNSLSCEHGSYLPTIEFEELQLARKNAGKDDKLWTIIMCRNLDRLNFSDQLFTIADYPVLICCLDNHIGTKKAPPGFKLNKLSTITDRQQLSNKNILLVDDSLEELVKKFKQLEFDLVLNESPFFHHYFLGHQLLDELWLNYSGSYIGGNITSLGYTQQSFTSTHHPGTKLLTLHHIDYHFLYSRQKIVY